MSVRVRSGGVNVNVWGKRGDVGAKGSVARNMRDAQDAVQIYCRDFHDTCDANDNMTHNHDSPPTLGNLYLQSKAQGLTRQKEMKRELVNRDDNQSTP